MLVLKEIFVAINFQISINASWKTADVNRRIDRFTIELLLVECLETIVTERCTRD